MLERLKTPETKPFYLTSEFWLLALAAANTIVISNPSDIKTLVSDALVAAYGIARGLAKAGSSAEPAGEGDIGAVTDLPQAGTSDIPTQFPPEDGSGVKGVEAPPAPTAAASSDLGSALTAAREIITEHPEIVQQLKTEGVIS